MEDCRSRRSQVMLSREGIASFISAKTSEGCLYFHGRPSRLASSTVIQRSSRVSPGKIESLAAHLHLAVVLVTVPDFSGHAEEGSTTSATSPSR